MVRPEESRPVPDGVRAEAGSRPVGDAAVEGDAEDGDVAGVDVLAAREPREGGRPREARDLERVDRPHRRRTVLLARAVRSPIASHGRRC
jgi:hypothetical protein